MSKNKPTVRARSTKAASSGEGYWLVSLQHNRSAVVEASNENAAIQVYKDVMGIRSSDHEFKAEYLEDGFDHLEVDDFGVVLGDAKSTDGDPGAHDE